jgi:hypothetical protein
MRKRVFHLLVAWSLATSALAAQTTVEWTVFKSPGSEFSVSLPVKPDYDEKTDSKPQGKVVTHLYSAKSENSFFIIAFTDYPVDVEAQGEIDLDRDNFMKEISATLVSEKEVTQSGLHGREFTCKNAKGLTARGRIFVERNRRAYMAVYAAFETLFDTAQSDRFLASFEMNPKN